MTTIGITGSTGQLGKLIIERLRAEPIPGATVRLIVRDAARAPQLTDASGAAAEVRVAEYGDRVSARAALDVERLTGHPARTIEQAITDNPSLLNP